MRIKCPKCGTGKARRHCAREGNAEICSECCASIRDADCGDCVHYAAVLRYENNRHVSGSLPEGHFMVEINPGVQKAVNTALEIAQGGKTHKAMAIYPYSLESHYNKAVAFQMLLDVPNCIRSYQKVVEIGPSDDPEVAKARSHIESMAAAILETDGVALDAFLKSGDKFNQAIELMERGDWKGALAGFRAAAAINGRNVPCHGNMGICLGQLGHKAEALAELDRALEINPEYQPARSNRMLLEQMEEGRPLAKNTQGINYAIENCRKTRQ
jgi:tetratricopeptide (TPR) repeat protein